MSVHDAFDEVVRSTLAAGLAVRFRADGDSMHPTIRDGDAIVVERVAGVPLVAGDVLLCRCAGRYMAHRVVAVERAGDGAVRIRGDAKMACDEPVPLRDVIGKVTFVVRGPRIIAVSGRYARVRYRLRAVASRAQRRFRAAAVPTRALC